MIKRTIGNGRGFTIGELIVVFSIVIIVGALMLPFIRDSRRRTEKILCADNLRKLGLGLYIYASEHGGKFPPTLKTIYDEQYLADPRLADCPAGKDEGTPGSPEYIYTAGLSIRSSSQDPLLRDKAENHLSTGKNILYVNGAVVWKD